MNICVAYQHIGYKKHPNIKNKLIIDENVANIVREIFDMYANEHGTVEIVNYLNKNKYLSPAGYRKTGMVQDKKKTNYNWNEVTLCNMLKNEVYIGNTIQNKKTSISYKVKKIKTIEKENQIKVNNTHEPIIDKDIFEKVNKILEKRGTNTKFKYDYLLRNMLYCYHCKRKLQIVLKKNSKANAKSHPYITCVGHKKRGCPPLNINYEKFEKYILYIVRTIIQNYANKSIMYSIYKNNKIKNNSKQEFLNKKIMQINKIIYEINNNIDKIYMDKLKGIILEEDYIRYSQKIISERTNLIKQKKELKQKLIQIENNNIKNKTKEEFDKLIKDFLKLEKIEKIYLYRLINKIEIDKNKKIYIYFNCSDYKIKDLLNFDK